VLSTIHSTLPAFSFKEIHWHVITNSAVNIQRNYCNLKHIRRRAEGEHFECGSNITTKLNSFDKFNELYYLNMYHLYGSSLTSTGMCVWLNLMHRPKLK